MNLGWKLAATIRGEAPGDLLDTYAAERHPVGAQILDWSRAQVALMRPAESSRALGSIVRDLIETQDGATYFAERVWGATLRYDLGNAHPLVGRSAPDFEVSGGRKLADYLRAGKGLLLEFGDYTLSPIAGAWKDRIAYARGNTDTRFGLSAMLVRPDGVVGWASESTSDAKELLLQTTRWFGASQQAV